MADTIEKVYCTGDGGNDNLAAALLARGRDNTQRVIDVLNNHWQQDLQQRYNDARLELSQQRQNAELIAALKTTTTTTGA